MRVEPESGLALAAGQVDLPDPIERHGVEERGDALASIAGIAQYVVQIEQDAAIRRFRHRGDEFAIGEFARQRRQVADRRLDGERNIPEPGAVLRDIRRG